MEHALEERTDCATVEDKVARMPRTVDDTMHHENNDGQDDDSGQPEQQECRQYGDKKLPPGRSEQMVLHYACLQ